MKIIETIKIKTYGECLSLKISEKCKNIFIGSSNKTYSKISFSNNFPLNPKIEILNDFNKSVKNVVYSFLNNIEYYGCVSYDGTGIIYKNGIKFDSIEGPETEIKHISFNELNNLIAISTRGKTVWILNINEDSLEINSILDDHSQDVKGAKFFNNQLFTFGYDETIKIYSFIKGYDNSLILTNNISLKSLEIKNNEKNNEKDLIFNNFTVWDLLFFNNFIIAAVNTEIFIFDLEMNLKYKERVSDYPIYQLVKLNESKFILIFNENNLKWIEINNNFKIKSTGIFKNICLRINSIDYNNDLNILVVGGEDNYLKILKLDIS